MSFVHGRLNLFSEINPSRAGKLFQTDIITVLTKIHMEALDNLRSNKLFPFQSEILANHVVFLHYYNFSHIKLCIEDNYNILMRKFPADSRNIFVKTEFENYLPRIRELRKSIQQQDLQFITSYEDYEFYLLEVGISTHIICWKAVSRDNYIFYEEYLNNLINFLEEEFLDSDILTKLEKEIPQMELFTANKSEKIVYLEQLGVLNFLRGKEPFNTSTNALAQAVSRFTGIKTGTVQSYLNPMNNSDLNQKNNPLTNKRIDKIKDELLKLGFKPD